MQLVTARAWTESRCQDWGRGQNREQAPTFAFLEARLTKGPESAAAARPMDAAGENRSEMVPQNPHPDRPKQERNGEQLDLAMPPAPGMAAMGRRAARELAAQQMWERFRAVAPFARPEFERSPNSIV